MRHMAQVASKTCDICTSAPERHFCIECEQHFCDNCKGLHTRQKATRQHKFQESSKMVQVYNIKEAVSSWNTIVKNEIETTLQEDVIILDELEKGIDTYDTQVKSVIEGIRENEKRIKQMIDKKVKSMIDEVKLKTSCEKDKMVNLVTATKSRIETKSFLEDRRKHLEKEMGNVDVMFDMQTLHEKFSKIEIRVFPLFPSIKYKLKETSELDLFSMFGTFISRPLSDDLPDGFEMRRDKDGKPYYVDRNTNSTTWDISLPNGWEKMYTDSGLPYYIDHNTKTTTLTHP